MSSIELVDFNQNNVINIKSHKYSYYDNYYYYIEKGVINPLNAINKYYNNLPLEKKEKLKGYIIDNTIETLFHCAKIYSTYQLIRVFI